MEFRRHGFSYRLVARSSRCRARSGIFGTPHGEVRTPAFMPVGTKGTVKGVFPRDLAATGTTMLLANTYHLHLRPGEDVVQKLGGLHRRFKIGPFRSCDAAASARALTDPGSSGC